MDGRIGPAVSRTTILGHQVCEWLRDDPGPPPTTILAGYVVLNANGSVVKTGSREECDSWVANALATHQRQAAYRPDPFTR